MKKKLTSEEILKLPKDEFLKFMDESKKSLYKVTFIKSLPKDYQEYDFDKKVDYWTETLNQGMRYQVEKGFNEYLVFSPEWYEAFASIDSNIDNIMDKVFYTFSKYDWNWSKEEYLKRIKHSSSLS